MNTALKKLKKASALVLGYGQLGNGEIDDQTKNRCDKAVKLYRQGKIGHIYLTTASRKRKSMALAMRDYLIKNGVHKDDIIVRRQGTNTAGEINAFLQCLPAKSSVFFISSWYHIPRIMWFSLWRISPLRSAFGCALKHNGWKADIKPELCKIAMAFIRPYKSAKSAYAKDESLRPDIAKDLLIAHGEALRPIDHT